MKHLFAISLLSVMMLAGCDTSTPPPSEPTNTEDPVSDPTQSNVESDEELWLSFGDLQFKLPDGWTVAQEMQGSEGIKKASVNVPDSQYDVQLTMVVTEGTTYDVDQEPLAQNQDAKVYLVPCGGAFACYALVYQDEYKREYAFDIISTEPVPENLDGVWNPSTEVTREELVDFLMGVSLTEMNP